MSKKLLPAFFFWMFLFSWAFAQNAQEYYKNGYVYFSQGNYEKALEAYQKSLELDPQYWDAYYWLGKTYEQLGNISEAVKSWRAVLVAQPLHKESFQKWRSYAIPKEISKEEKERLKDSFFYKSAPSIGKEEAWSRVIPGAFSLMREKKLDSLRLAGVIMQWAGRNVSALLIPYERLSYQRALEALKENLSQEDLYVVYEFLQECLLLFENDQEMLRLVNEILGNIFVAEAQISQKEEVQTMGIEFRIYQDRVEKEALNFLEDVSTPKMKFYWKENGAEGGS
ncbi:MAG: tetratricopeptide repeat protein [Candidatus Caldatribacteriaceae bacterium]